MGAQANYVGPIAFTRVAGPVTLEAWYVVSLCVVVICVITPHQAEDHPE
jgi:hypothetical protein